MKISIITLFPEMFTGPFDFSIVKRAKEKGQVEINIVHLREFGIGKHQIVDDRPFGGGIGMVLKVDVLHKAIKNTLDKKIDRNKQKVVLLAAHGKKFTWEKAKEYTEIEHLILICGHYEGVDERIKEYIDEEISIGDFIVTGGELPAMLITDAVVRLLRGVLKEGAATNESFYNQLESPHYTQPRVYKGNSVPKVLLSGNHAQIEEWKKKQSNKVTKKLRPDLLSR